MRDRESLIVPFMEVELSSFHIYVIDSIQSIDYIKTILPLSFSKMTMQSFDVDDRLPK